MTLRKCQYPYLAFAITFLINILQILIYVTILFGSITNMDSTFIGHIFSPSKSEFSDFNFFMSYIDTDNFINYYTICLLTFNAFTIIVFILALRKFSERILVQDLYLNSFLNFDIRSLKGLLLLIISLLYGLIDFYIIEISGFLHNAQTCSSISLLTLIINLIVQSTFLILVFFSLYAKNLYFSHINIFERGIKEKVVLDNNNLLNFIIILIYYFTFNLNIILNYLYIIGKKINFIDFLYTYVLSLIFSIIISNSRDQLNNQDENMANREISGYIENFVFYSIIIDQLFLFLLNFSNSFNIIDIISNFNINIITNMYAPIFFGIAYYFRKLFDKRNLGIYRVFLFLIVAIILIINIGLLNDITIRSFNYGISTVLPFIRVIYILTPPLFILASSLYTLISIGLNEGLLLAIYLRITITWKDLNSSTKVPLRYLIEIFYQSLLNIGYLVGQIGVIETIYTLIFKSSVDILTINLLFLIFLVLCLIIPTATYSRFIHNYTKIDEMEEFLVRSLIISINSYGNKKILVIGDEDYISNFLQHLSSSELFDFDMDTVIFDHSTYRYTPVGSNRLKVNIVGLTDKWKKDIVSRYSIPGLIEVIYYYPLPSKYGKRYMYPIFVAKSFLSVEILDFINICNFDFIICGLDDITLLEELFMKSKYCKQTLKLYHIPHFHLFKDIIRERLEI